VTVRLADLRPLPRSFYARDPRRVARELLGKVLVRRRGRQLLAGRIVEVEAYLGAGDLAAHSAAGKTARNAVLFGAPGHAYVYFIYGAHYCFNVSCEAEGEAGCILIRALEPLTGLRAMAKARGVNAAAAGYANLAARPKLLRHLTSGPGRLCQALSITRARDNGEDVTTARSSLYIARDGSPRPRIATTPRIGVSKAEKEKLRYVVVGNEFVSGSKK